MAAAAATGVEKPSPISTHRGIKSGFDSDDNDGSDRSEPVILQKQTAMVLGVVMVLAREAAVVAMRVSG